MSQQRSRRGSRDAGIPQDRPAPITAQLRQRVREVVEPVISAAGYDLEDLTIQRVGRRHLLRIAVDSDRGINLDQIADLSRDISAGLDAVEAAGDELIAGEYELEVGSRGVDRPLTEPRHWRRNVGRLIQVNAGNQQLTARITAADQDGVTLEETRYAFADLGPGRIQVELKRLETVDEDELEDLGEDEE
jgi:ribosome maturation factor RimP